MSSAWAPFIIAAVFVAIIVVLKVVEIRLNNKRRRQGLPPLTEEQEIHDVIDWSKRK